MIVKGYKAEDFKVGDKLVELTIFSFDDTYCRVSEPKEITRVTDKTVFYDKGRKLMDAIGKKWFSSFMVKEEDVDYAIESYKKQTTRELEQKIKIAQAEIENLKNLKVRGVKTLGY
jgi:hypothetical protein